MHGCPGSTSDTRARAYPACTARESACAKADAASREHRPRSEGVGPSLRRMLELPMPIPTRLKSQVEIRNEVCERCRFRRFCKDIVDSPRSTRASSSQNEGHVRVEDRSILLGIGREWERSAIVALGELVVSFPVIGYRSPIQRWTSCPHSVCRSGMTFPTCRRVWHYVARFGSLWEGLHHRTSIRQMIFGRLPHTAVHLLPVIRGKRRDPHWKRLRHPSKDYPPRSLGH